MSYIDLTDDRYLGRFDLPGGVTSTAGEGFALGYAIRQGGNGVVFTAYRAGRKPGGPDCAVKFLKRLDAQRRDRFDNEVRILARLSHPTISAYFGHGSVPLGPDVVVPWVSMDLGSHNLREQIDNNGPLNRSLLLPVSMQMCDAVAYAHSQGLIHRDIKPDNFVWTTATTVKMIDFGIAKFLGEDVSARPLDDFTRSNEFVGPQLYSSPELLAYARDKSHAVDHRSDVFQLAKVIWFLATGRVSAGIPARRLCPFEGKLWDGLIGSFSDDPVDRPDSALALKTMLADLSSLSTNAPSSN